MSSCGTSPTGVPGLQIRTLSLAPRRRIPKPRVRPPPPRPPRVPSAFRRLLAVPWSDPAVDGFGPWTINTNSPPTHTSASIRTSHAVLRELQRLGPRPPTNNKRPSQNDKVPPPGTSPCFPQAFCLPRFHASPTKVTPRPSPKKSMPPTSIARHSLRCTRLGPRQHIHPVPHPRPTFLLYTSPLPRNPTSIRMPTSP